MKILGVFLLAVWLNLCSSLRILKGKEIPSDYAIDMEEGVLFFRSMNDVMGRIERSTGILKAVYQLEQGQKILSYFGATSVITVKNHDINMFLPMTQEYVKLSYSQFLQKQTFTEIKAFRRSFNYDYILTDQFLLKARNPYSLHRPQQSQTSQQFEIIANREGPNSLFFDLILTADPKFEDVAMALVIVKSNGDQKQLCIRKMYLARDKVSEKCMQLQSKQKLRSVMEVGNSIIVAYQNYKVVLNHKMEKTHTLKSRDKVSFVEQLKIVDDNKAAKNLVSDSLGHTLSFFNVGNPKGSDNIQYFDKYMLVRVGDKIITNIPKNSEDKPISAWAFTPKPSQPQFLLIVQYSNGKIECYQISESNKNSKRLWNFTVKDPQPIDITKGLQKQAQEVDLKEEETLIEKTASKEKEAERIKENDKPGEQDLDQDQNMPKNGL